MCVYVCDGRARIVPAVFIVGTSPSLPLRMANIILVLVGSFPSGPDTGQLPRKTSETSPERRKKISGHDRSFGTRSPITQRDDREEYG